MSCNRLHSDPNDRPSNRHIATCYSAYETYWDRDGMVSEEVFDAGDPEERLRDIQANGGPQVDDEEDAQYD